MAGSAARSALSETETTASTTSEPTPERLTVVRESSTLSLAGEARNAQALAEQTGLLALNASIEAARTRSGRRFDIVDGRVAELAPVTAPSAAVVRDVPPAQHWVHHDGAGITPLSLKSRRRRP